MVTSVGALSMQEFALREQAKPQANGILPTDLSHLETGARKNKEPRIENLTHLIHEAQKRTEARRRSSDSKMRGKALATYANLRDFEEISDTLGLNLDREA